MGVLKLSDYIHSIKKWSDDILEFYNESVSRLDRTVSSEQLNQWKEEFNAFQENLSRGNHLSELEVYQEANQLSSQLQSYFPDFSDDVADQTRAEARVKRVPIGGHSLPPLPYPYDALEPYIDRETMDLHHNKHHKSYVDGLNKAELEMQKARKSNNFDLIKHWEREAAFNGAGHYLHTIFWNVMSPNGGGQPTGRLMREINQSFGSFDQFKKHFTEAANKVEGGGWTILVWSPRSRRLEILQAEKHQNLSQWDIVPLLVLDVWEHAYYLKYKNEKKKYVDNWWNVVNWPEVEARYNQASKLKWTAY